MKSSFPPKCVILPCAGYGTRLGLPYPKELHFVGPDKALIDFSINMLGEIGSDFYVLIVLRPGKEQIRTYVESRWPHISFQFVMQTSPGFIGALKSSMNDISEHNLILLPDQYVESHNSVRQVFDYLAEGEPTAVMTCLFEATEQLIDDGAVKIIDNRIALIAEKPTREYAKNFNGIWCGIGVAQTAFEPLIDFLQILFYKSSPAVDEWHKSPLFNAPSVLVSDYIDLGVWERLIAFQLRNQCE